MGKKVKEQVAKEQQKYQKKKQTFQLSSHCTTNSLMHKLLLCIKTDPTSLVSNTSCLLPVLSWRPPVEFPSIKHRIECQPFFCSLIVNSLCISGQIPDTTGFGDLRMKSVCDPATYI